MLTHFVPKLLAKITGKPRYLPKIVWSDKSFVHNFFRVYETIFWRRYGIRPELSLSWGLDKNGRLILVHNFFTFEAILAYVEGVIRNGFGHILKPFKIFIPKLSTNDGISFDSGILFAIAFDAAGAADRWGTGSSSSITISLTVSGSDRFIMGATSTNQSVTPTAMAYNSDSLSSIDSVVGGDAPDIYAYGLIAPDTGTNNLVVTLSTSTIYIFGKAVSYTGVDQTDAVGTTFEVTHESSTTIEQNITSTVANSLLVDFVSGQNASYTITADDGQDIRSNTTVGGGLRFIVADKAAASITTYTNGYTMSSATGFTLLTIEVLPLVIADITVNPSAQSLALTLNAPTVAIDDSFSASAQSLSLTLETPTVIAGTSVLPSAQSLALTLNAPTLSLDWTVAVSDLSITSSVLSPSLVLGITIFPEAFDLALTINQIGNRWNPRIPISSSWTNRTAVSTSWTPRTPL